MITDSINKPQSHHLMLDCQKKKSTFTLNISFTWLQLYSTSPPLFLHVVSCDSEPRALLWYWYSVQPTGLFRQTVSTFAGPLNSTAAGSSAAARHLWVTQGSIDLIGDDALRVLPTTTPVVHRKGQSKRVIRKPSRAFGPLLISLP